MKKFVIFMLAVILIVSMCACSQQSSTSESSETVESTESTESQLHTIAQPKDDSEVEWGHINGEVTINDASGEVILTKEDMSGFAIIGSNDDDSCFKMILSDTGSDILNSINTKDFSIYIDGEKLCDFTYEPDENGAFSFGDEFSYKELCEAATRIRGLD